MCLEKGAVFPVFLFFFFFPQKTCPSKTFNLSLSLNLGFPHDWFVIALFLLRAVFSKEQILNFLNFFFLPPPVLKTPFSPQMIITGGARRGTLGPITADRRLREGRHLHFTPSQSWGGDAVMENELSPHA